MPARTFFQSMDSEDLSTLITSVYIQQYPDKILVLKKGDLGNNFYIVRSGKFIVVKPPKEDVAETFGEFAL